MLIFVRGEASKALSTQSESIWDRIGLLWRALALSFDPGNVASSLGASEDSRISLVLALGKLERNLVARLQAHQEAAACVSESLQGLS